MLTRTLRRVIGAAGVGKTTVRFIHCQSSPIYNDPSSFNTLLVKMVSVSVMEYYLARVKFGVLE
jgi:hypothetical protein